MPNPRSDANERLMGDAMAGHGALFTGEEGVEAVLSVVQPVLGRSQHEAGTAPAAPCTEAR